jgi:peroxidase
LKGSDNAWIGGSRAAYDLSQEATLLVTAYKELYDKDKATALSYRSCNLKLPHPYCPKVPVINCNRTYEFRTIDGSCNNLGENRTWWGKAETPQKRLLPSEYDDHANEPRVRSVVPKKYLPNARKVAMNIFEASPTVSEWSHFMTYFGQFLDHDLTLTAQSTYSDGFRRFCRCNSYDPDCFNIPIPHDDLANNDQTCMSFVRSIVSVSSFQCDLGPREQLNVQTAWMDLSMVYGHSAAWAEKLRSFENGTLKSSINENGEFLPNVIEGNCLNSKYTTEYSRRAKCFLTGDARAEDNSILTSIHTIWLREHNRIARKLHELNPCWDDETLYQQARRICIALFQSVVYGEFLPGLLGQKLVNLYGLVPQKRGYFSGYNSTLYPQIINEFSTAAFRYGHTQVTYSQHTASKTFDLSDPKPISFYMFNNVYYKTSMDEIIRGNLVDWSYAPNPQANKYLGDWLWNGLFSMDSLRWSLPAMNIQRGRDHGLPSYNKYRKLCGLNLAYSFDEFYNIPASVIAKLNETYASPDDVDLFTGLFSEFPIEGAMVGATAGCKCYTSFKENQA